ncbi:uncharacterized protein METZ01_LOCUS168756 [marine metagenome]|jgi:hypothetical protein|uniref:Uncharacterized protein n=1 Tax=marine metagenome TaxID=408172 RepID=A0A382BR53_9ZZZZ|tara:strand:+ start:166 stop:390 length:225 start_codon:yes stop_codon:yes gene_type:complete
MPKYTCTVKAIIHITKEVTDTIEIEAPDEVQAEEDAETAAQLMDNTWLNHPEIDYKEFHEDIEFKVEDVEEKIE